jgi:hypothetical protein
MRASGRNYNVYLGMMTFVLGTATASILVQPSAGRLAGSLVLSFVVRLNQFAEELAILCLIRMLRPATAPVFLGQMLGATLAGILFIMFLKWMCHSYFPFGFLPT